MSEESITSTLSHQEQQIRTRRGILSSIAKYGLLRPTSARDRGLTPTGASGEYKSKRAIDENRISGVVILDDTNRDIERIKHISPFDGKNDYDTIRFQPFGRVHYQLKIYPSDPAYVNLAEERIKAVLYSSMQFGVLPVITERHWETPNQRAGLDISGLNARVSNSILIAVRLRDIPIQGVNDLENYSESDIPPNKFVAVLVPEFLLKDAEDAFENSGVKLFSVPTKEVMLPIASDRQPNAIRSVSVPDYESILKKLITEGKDSLFIHGVRLPTLEDIRHTRVAVPI